MFRPTGKSCLLLALAPLMSGVVAVHAVAKCQIEKLVEVPITMEGLRPMVSAKINDRDARFVLDSGAFYSIISSATAAEFDLKLAYGRGLTVRGIGGMADASVTKITKFTIADLSIQNVEFLVGGSEVGGSGLLGQNFLDRWDDEYDFAKGVLRLFKAEDCRKAVLAYWITPGQSFSEMRIEEGREGHGSRRTIGEGYVNGTKIRVKFDTGAWTSVLTLKAAAHAGINIDSPGVVDAGYSRGIGPGVAKQYIARFSSFKIGDGEEIKNSRLRMADIDLLDADMLLGADFFVSHHVYVANSQHKLYLTYNGGPVFNLSKGASAQEPAPPGASIETADSPNDAAELSRLGAASATRRDFDTAIADLSKAVELSPDEPEYLYQRALVYRQSGQVKPALDDLDRALLLKPDFLFAYLPRAEIRLHEKNVDAAIADLDALDRLAARQSDLRLVIAARYEAADRYSPAITQYDLWIQYHPNDSRIVAALGARCLASALQNQDLPGGLDSCNRGLKIADKKNPHYGILFANRGFIRLRQGENAKAISDFDATLKILPKSALALCGRGIAKSRTGNTSAGEADIADAVRIAPNIEAQLERRGITP